MALRASATIFDLEYEKAVVSLKQTVFLSTFWRHGR
jgi:hypothetical protein